MSARESLVCAAVWCCLAVAGCSSDPAAVDAGVDVAADSAVDAVLADLPVPVDVSAALDVSDVSDASVTAPDVDVDANVLDADDAAADTTALDADDAAIDVAAIDADDATVDAPDVGDVATDRADASLDARPDVSDAARDVAADVGDVSLDVRDAVADVRDALADVRDAVADAPSDAPADAATGPRVDRTMPQLYTLTFRANDADPAARLALGTETAYLDTRVAPRNVLVVYLHGAGAPTTCGSNEHERLLSSWGFHVLGPCYVSDYGVGNCGADIAGCRLEAFDGVDHHPFVNITPPDSIETRVVQALALLQRRNPAGDWQWFIDGGRPRWSSIIISGISHGASSSGLIAQVRPVARAVMLSGPLDTGQAWLTRVGLTPATGFWGLTHMADPQHSGHVAAFASLRLPGALTNLDTTPSPFGGSHRLTSAAMTTDGHGSTQAGGVSPRDAMGRYLFEPAWRAMYGVTP
jgi:hypothetical protein